MAQTIKAHRDLDVYQMVAIFSLSPRHLVSLSQRVCVYRDMQPGEPEMTEDEAIPAHPGIEAWQ